MKQWKYIYKTDIPWYYIYIKCILYYIIYTRYEVLTSFTKDHWTQTHTKYVYNWI